MQNFITVRAKFQLQEIRNYASGTGKTYVFRPQYDSTIEEDRRFSKYTPSGEFTMLVDNPAVESQFILGASYYFDVIPVPVQQKAAG